MTRLLWRAEWTRQMRESAGAHAFAETSGHGAHPERVSSTGTFDDPFAARAGIRRLWRGLRFRLPRDTRKSRLGSGSA